MRTVKAGPAGVWVLARKRRQAMTLEMKTGWDTEARDWLKDANQVYIDCFTEAELKNAILKAKGYFGDEFEGMITAAEGTEEVVTIEQGAHQPQNTEAVQGLEYRGGFTLHTTVRWNGKAWHLYLSQAEDGTLQVENWSHY
jgi:hypothetical protein